MNYIISHEANLDLQNIWQYTYKNWSLEQADRYLNLILDEVEFLAETPDSGDYYGSVRKEYFRSRVKSHFIFYKVNRNKKEIEIIRILYQRMDIKGRLNE